MAFMAQAQFMSRNHAEVARIYRERERKFPGVVNPNGSVIEAAAYTLLGQPEEAAAVVKALLDAQPGFNLSQWRYLNSWKSEENRNRLYEAARKAGIPEVAKRP